MKPLTCLSFLMCFSCERERERARGRSVFLKPNPYIKQRLDRINQTMSSGSSSLFTSLGAALHNLSSPRFSLRGGGSSPSAKSNPGHHAFESELATAIEELKSTDDAGYLTIAWLCRGMGAVLSSHAAMEACLPGLQQGLSESDNKWLDEYLDDSVKLLDVCKTLKEAIEDVKIYHVLLEVALHTLEKGVMVEAQLTRAKNALAKCSEALMKRDDDMSQKRSKLENCSSMLRRMGEKLNTEDSSKGKVFTIIYACQVTTIFICGVLVAALSFKPRRPLTAISVAGQSSWSFALSSLQQRVKDLVEKKKTKGACALLEELEKTDTSVRCLQELVEKILNAKDFPVGENQATEVRQLLGNLNECSRELSQGLPHLEFHVGEVFKVLIASRMVLLNIFSYV